MHAYLRAARNRLVPVSGPSASSGVRVKATGAFKWFFSVLIVRSTVLFEHSSFAISSSSGMGLRRDARMTWS